MQTAGAVNDETVVDAGVRAVGVIAVTVAAGDLSWSWKLDESGWRTLLDTSTVPGLTKNAESVSTACQNTAMASQSIPASISLQ